LRADQRDTTSLGSYESGFERRGCCQLGAVPADDLGKEDEIITNGCLGGCLSRALEIGEGFKLGVSKD
jgi:hypothetical protein